MNTTIIPNALDISNEEYHADTSRVSKSGLDLINQSPAHYHYRHLREKTAEEIAKEKEDSKKYFKDGTAAHTAVFEPNEFESRYTTASTKEEIGAVSLVKELQDLADKHGVVYKKADTKPTLIKLIKDAGHEVKMYEDYLSELEHSGKIILTKEEYELYMKWRDAVHSHPASKILLNSGVAEKSFHFEDPNTGALCKIRTDWFSVEGYIVDLKTTLDASPKGFPKSIYNYRYDVAGAFYSDGFEIATGIKPDGFIIIALEKSAPYNVGAYALDGPTIRRGREVYREDLITYAACKDSGIWPGYSNQIESIGLPAWVK